MMGKLPSLCQPVLQERDPIPRFRDYVLQSGILTNEQLDEIDKEVGHPRTGVLSPFAASSTVYCCFGTAAYIAVRILC